LEHLMIVRWLPTFLGFPVGGWLAAQAVGSVRGPGSAALAGLIAGLAIGVAQWLVLRSRGADLRWVVYTALGMTVGGAAAAVLTGANTDVKSLVLTGLVAGAAVGAAQATLLAPSLRAGIAWSALVSIAWGLGWLTTANVIVDAESGFIIFGSSGALVVTVLTGLGMRWLLAVEAPAKVVPATPPVAEAHR
jgi:hypothetical protein